VLEGPPTSLITFGKFGGKSKTGKWRSEQGRPIVDTVQQTCTDCVMDAHVHAYLSYWTATHDTRSRHRAVRSQQLPS
jgi:hypothetical protein